MLDAQLLIIKKKNHLFKVIVEAQTYDHFCNLSVGDVVFMEK